MPVLLMLRPEKVATPLTALTVVVPLRVPLLGLAPIASVTALVAEVCGLLLASSIVTVIDEMGDPAAVFDGPTVNAS